jgi:hypothetical protein
MTNFLTGLIAKRSWAGISTVIVAWASPRLSRFRHDANAKWSKGASMCRTVSPQYFTSWIKSDADIDWVGMGTLAAWWAISFLGRKC